MKAFLVFLVFLGTGSAIAGTGDSTAPCDTSDTAPCDTGDTETGDTETGDTETGETGTEPCDTADTATPCDSGDTSETGDSADSGETGDVDTVSAAELAGELGGCGCDSGNLPYSATAMVFLLGVLTTRRRESPFQGS